MVLMLKRINGVYLDLRVGTLCVLTDLFQLWQTNPAEADYACIKLLQIAILLMRHLELKCSGCGFTELGSFKSVSLPQQKKEVQRKLCFPKDCHIDDWIQ